MADTKISALTAATTPLAGTEVLPIVQSSTTKKVAVSDLTAGRAVSALSLSLTNALTVANGGTNASSASITAFNNITGYTATGATGTTSTNLVFSTSPTITTPSVTGDLTMSTGNVVMSNGKGIDFSATPGTGTSELFADYEEGDFTPTFFYGATEVGYYSRGGKYTKIGRQVFCEISGYFLRGSGAASFGGLPFTAATWSGQPDLHPGTTGRDYPTNTDFTGYVNKGATTGDLNYSFSGSGDSEIRMFVTYFV